MVKNFSIARTNSETCYIISYQWNNKWMMVSYITCMYSAVHSFDVLNIINAGFF